MKYLLLLSFLLFGFISILPAQIPQITLVKPDGTTTVHTTFNEAYNAATDDDNIYLPGGVFNVTYPINKRIHIYGSGTNQDSCFISGISILDNIILIGGASGGSANGIKVNIFSFQNQGNNYTINLCDITGILFYGIWTNITIINNQIDGYGLPNEHYSIGGNAGGSISNSLIANNIILDNLNAVICNFLEVKNNIFFMNNVLLAPNSTYANNIFNWVDFAGISNSNFLCNVNLGTPGGINNYFNNNIEETWPDIFINPGPDPYNYDEHNNYHVKLTSLCHNSGTDGTDRGIYSGDFPWIEGMVTSNPHIFYKQVPGVTNSNGQLQIHLKVRTNSD